MNLWAKCSPLCIDPCRRLNIDLHRWWCFNLNRWMDSSYYVDTLSIYLRVEIPPLYPIRKFGTIGSWRIIEKILGISLLVLMIEECSWWSIDAISCLHWKILVNIWHIFWIHFYRLIGKSIWRGAHLWKTSTLFSCLDLVVIGSIFIAWSLTLIFYFSSTIVLFLGQSN